MLVCREMGTCPSTTSLYSLETGAPKLTMLCGRKDVCLPDKEVLISEADKKSWRGPGNEDREILPDVYTYMYTL